MSEYTVDLPADMVAIGLPDQISAELINYLAYPWDGKYPKRHYAVTIPGIEKPFDFYTGSYDFSESEALSFLGCIFTDADCGSMIFVDFCDNFGYDADSRSAHKTWEACQETYVKLRAQFGSKIDAIREYLQEAGY